MPPPVRRGGGRDADQGHAVAVRLAEPEATDAATMMTNTTPIIANGE
jgi:hypothetical protein